jgi:hypothetical protein
MALPSDTYVVSELQRLPGGLWACLIDLPDGTTRRIVVPANIASISGVALSASVIAGLIEAGTAVGGPT